MLSTNARKFALAGGLALAALSASPASAQQPAK